MQSYRNRIGLVPGPVSVPENIRSAWNLDYASPDLEHEFFDLYRENQALTQQLLHTRNQIIIMSGEAMQILWAALKCTLRPGERMLAVSSGLFGEGFAEMAESFGVNAQVCSFHDNSVPDPQRVYEHAKKFRPKVITAVHCETPSGTLTPESCLEAIGNIAREIDALFVVDFVSSAGGAPLDVDACKIDIGLLGSQKVLSVTPALAISSVSSRAWEVIKDVNYAGYEAYAPWQDVPESKYTPYTHDWAAMKALNLSLGSIMNEGPERVIKRHEEAARLCRSMGLDMGLRLFPESELISSPTVSAFYVPERFTWSEFDSSLRKNGLIVGGNYGRLSGKVFRIGHMGTQADCKLVTQGMEIIKQVIAH